MDEPALRAWMHDIVSPATHYAERPGRWVTEAQWPPPDNEEQVWPLEGDFPLEHRSSASTGADGGAWCPDGGEGDWPADQRAEDERSLAFTFQPLERDVEILGFPEVELALSVDRPQALIAVRLCAVEAEGASLLITRGMLNLTHRDGHAEPEPLEPGRRYDVRVRLDAIAHALPAGRRLRLSVSTVYWPWLWPSPEPVTLTLHEGRLLLPVRPTRNEAEPAPFGPPEWAPPLEVETIEPGRTRREHRHDPETGLREIEFEWNVGGHRRLVQAGTEMLDTNVTIYRIADDDPTSAEVEVHTTTGLGRGEWQTRVESESRMSSTTTEFLVTQLLKAFEGGEQVYSRAWELKLPRDNV